MKKANPLLKFSNCGFTIIETLVVIAILAIVGVLILIIFTQSLRANNKAQIISSIKKNGQTVLETMDKVIRNADKVVCVGTFNTLTPNDSIVVVNGGTYTRYRFIAAVGTTTNGQIQQDSPQPPSVGANDPSGKYSQAYLCTNPLGVESPTPFQTLTDTDANNGVSVLNGSFTRNPKPGFKDTVTISFQVARGVAASNATATQVDPVSFSETIELR